MSLTYAADVMQCTSNVLPHEDQTIAYIGANKHD